MRQPRSRGCAGGSGTLRIGYCEGVCVCVYWIRAQGLDIRYLLISCHSSAHRRPALGAVRGAWVRRGQRRSEDRVLCAVCGLASWVCGLFLVNFLSPPLQRSARSRRKAKKRRHRLGATRAVEQRGLGSGVGDGAARIG